MPSKSEFKKVCAELEAGEDLTLLQIGRVFGDDFWMLIVYAFLDSQDAARAIQNAIARLSTRDVVEQVTGAEVV